MDEGVNYDYDYDAQVSAEVERVLVTVSSTAGKLHLPSSLLTEVLNSLRVSTLRSVIISGGSITPPEMRFDDAATGHFVRCIQQSNILLECLSLPHHRIGDVGLGYICQTLVYGNGNGNGIGTAGSGSGSDAQLEVQNMRLEVLDLEGNDITGKGLHHLRMHSQEECSLLSLNLSGNCLNEEGGMIVAEALTSNRTIRQLIVNNCGFSLNAAIAVATSLGKQSKMGALVLEELQIDRPCLKEAVGEEAVDHFARVCGNTNVTSLAALSIKFYGIGDLGARLLGQALTRNVSLVSLNLESNKIGAIGAEALASCIILQAKSPSAAGPGLKSLRMSYNQIGDDGAIALAEALTQSSTLLELSLKNNSIRRAGLVKIAESLLVNQTIEAISLFGNDFDHASGKVYQDVLSQRRAVVGRDGLDLEIDLVIFQVDGGYQVAEA